MTSWNTPEEITEKMNRAKHAQETWSSLSLKKRIEYLKKLRKQLLKKRKEVISILQNEAHKTPTDTLTAEILATADAIVHYEKEIEGYMAEETRKTPFIYGKQRTSVVRKPLGTIAVFSPWNFPLQLSMVPALTALVTGNTVVLKPSEVLPKLNKWMEELFSSVFPTGTVEVVHGGKEQGIALVDAKPEKIFFTGSVPVGKAIMKHAADYMIPVDLELGGKDPMIVCEDANVNRAVEAGLYGSFLHSGQVCVSVERIYVHQSIYRDFVEKLRSKALELTQGTDFHSDMGGMTTRDGFERVKKQVGNAIFHGAACVTDETWKQAEYPYFPPTILTNVNQGMEIMQEETFGPVVTVTPYSSEEEAIRLANDSRFGLNASIFSNNTEKGKQLAERLNTGSVYVNDVIKNIANMNAPFGGVKESGAARYHGREGVEAFTYTQAIMIEKGKRKRSFNYFPYSKKNFKRIERLLAIIYGRK